MSDDGEDDIAAIARARAAGSELWAEHAPAGDPFAAAVRATRMAMIITDPHLADNPIVYVNQAFCSLTGYEEREVIGRNCRFLQGVDTDPRHRVQIRDYVMNNRDLHIEILNYKKDGTPFWNSLFVSPVLDRQGEISHFFASQLDVTERKERERGIERLASDLAEAKSMLEGQVDERTAALMQTLETRTKLLTELDHRVKNNLQLMISLVNLEKRHRSSEPEHEALEAIRVRLHALELVHRKLYNEDSIGRFDVSEFVRNIVEDHQLQSGRSDIKLVFQTEPVSVTSAKAGPVALFVNELVGAAMRYAYQGRRGSLKVGLRAIRQGAAEVFELSIADDGYTAREKDDTRRSTAGTIVALLARQLDASIDWCEGDAHMLVRVTMPCAEPEPEPGRSQVDLSSDGRYVIGRH